MGKEKEIFKPDYLKNITRKGDLISRLDELHKALSELSQEPDDRPKHINEICSLLVTKIMKNSDRDVRLLAGCCLVDILRITAPETPLRDNDMVSAFEVIVSLLTGLSNYTTKSGTGSKLFYILNSLATIKSCVVPVILSQSNVPGASEVVVSLFDALISSCRPDHSEDG